MSPLTPALREPALRRFIGRTLLPLLVGLLLLVPGSLDAADARPKYAGIVIDAHTGKVIYSRNADAHRFPASLTKVMTLYILFEEMRAGRMSKSTMMRVSAHAAAQAPSKLGLKPGEEISVENAIKALVTKSANDIAVVVAEAIAGTESRFAQRMTKTARRLGMTRTTFRNASGLPNSSQVTTARDMATLGLRVQRDFPAYYQYFATRSFTFRGRKYRNHNRLLGHFDGVDGIKTGYTRASGFNLTASVRRDGKHLIGVVIGGKSGRSRDRQMQTILIDALPKAIAHKGAPQVVAAVPMPVPDPRSEGTLTDTDRVVPAKATVQPEVLTAVPVAVTSSEAEAEAKAAAETGSDLRQASGGDEGDAASDGTWSIQVGAYLSKEDAERRLSAAREAGVKTLKDKPGMTVTFNRNDQLIYRARFAGFDRATARRTCSILSRKSINCYALAP